MFLQKEAQCQDIAKQVLLVSMWLTHLKTAYDNRKRAAVEAEKLGHKKAKKKRNKLYFSGICHDQYVKFTEDTKHWIECGHSGISEDNIPDNYYCV